jgi:hypothetical protein
MTKAGATLSGSDHTLRSLAVRISDSHSGDPGSIPGEEEYRKSVPIFLKKF